MTQVEDHHNHSLSNDNPFLTYFSGCGPVSLRQRQSAVRRCVVRGEFESGTEGQIRAVAGESGARNKDSTSCDSSVTAQRRAGRRLAQTGCTAEGVGAIASFAVAKGTSFG
jgi:hypothetical protein